jgi:hypothetical protein
MQKAEECYIGVENKYGLDCLLCIAVLQKSAQNSGLAQAHFTDDSHKALSVFEPVYQGGKRFLVAWA